MYMYTVQCVMFGTHNTGHTVVGISSHPSFGSQLQSWVIGLIRTDRQEDNKNSTAVSHTTGVQIDIIVHYLSL